MTVSDARIIEAQAYLSSSAGLFTEPAGAAAFAGFQKIASTLDSAETVVVLTTGNGLKDCASAALGVQMPEVLVNTVEEIL